MTYFHLTKNVIFTQRTKATEKLINSVLLTLQKICKFQMILCHCGNTGC